MMAPGTKRGRGGMTVLVVDDEAAVAEFCRQVLSKAGHAVLIVKSGKEVLAALDEHEVDVVLSDVRMPGMDGVDLLRSILLYTSDAADEEDSVDLGGRRIIKKKKK